MSDNDFILEFISIGNTVKVTCIDPKTGREVSTLGPTSTPRSQLSKLAVKKMLYVLKKEQS